MPVVQWPLHNDRPVIQVELSLPTGQPPTIRRLIADTGAGSGQSVFELLLHEQDCLAAAGIPLGHVPLGGAYAGSFPLYLVQVRIAAMNFDEPVPVVGVAQAPLGFDGIAGFKFLSRFHYGNFAQPDSFGLDPLPGA